MKTFPLLASLFMVAAMVSDARAALGSEQTPRCKSIQVSSVPESRSRSFHASEISDLGFSVLFPPGTVFHGTEILTLKIRTPRGHLYRKLETPLAARTVPEGEVRARHVEGYPFPLRESSATTFGAEMGSFVVVLSPPFPVGGTTITTSSLYGQWTVEALIESAGHVQSEPGSCVARFRIEQ
ncbi:hypothetical protein EG835_07105 [bacterium]|nr:hypothetical protein [bacterium]